MKEIDKILIDCIEDIKTGKSTLEECLIRYPALQPDLEPLLRIAMSINEPDDIRISAEFKNRARVYLMQNILSESRKKRNVRTGFREQPPIRLVSFLSRRLAAGLTVVLILLLAGTGLVFAADHSIPGDGLYEVKLFTEQLQRLTTFDQISALDLELKFAAKRLNEMERIARLPDDNSGISSAGIIKASLLEIKIQNLETPAMQRPHRMAIAVMYYEQNLTRAIGKAIGMPHNQNPLLIVSNTIQDHLDRLDEIEDVCVALDLQASREIAIAGQIHALQHLVMMNPVKSVKIALVMAEDRFIRARHKSAGLDFALAEEALKEAERLFEFSVGISNLVYYLGQGEVLVDRMISDAAALNVYVLLEIIRRNPEQPSDYVAHTLVRLVSVRENAIERMTHFDPTTDKTGITIPADILNKMSPHFREYLPSSPLPLSNTDH